MHSEHHWSGVYSKTSKHSTLGTMQIQLLCPFWKGPLLGGSKCINSIQYRENNYLGLEKCPLKRGGSTIRHFTM